MKRAAAAKDENTAHAHCMLDNYGYRHTLTICNARCFATVTMAERQYLNVMLYVHGLSCFLSIHYPLICLSFETIYSENNKASFI